MVWNAEQTRVLFDKDRDLDNHRAAPLILKSIRKMGKIQMFTGSNFHFHPIYGSVLWYIFI